MHIHEPINLSRLFLFRRLRLLACVVLIVSLCGMLGYAETPNIQKPLVVFLVRHAEKVDASRDPQLSEAGALRAKLLKRYLRDTKIEHIHSSDFIRTKNTATPIATALGLKVELYNPRDLSGLVEHIRKTGGRHLVVGHSTTTPTVVEMLGGEPGTAINEQGEYDRLYIVTQSESNAVSTVLMRYGQP